MKRKFIISAFCLALLLVDGTRPAMAGTDSGGGWSTVGTGQMWGTVGAPYGTASVSVGTQTLIPSGQAEALALLMGPSGVAPTLSISSTNTLIGTVGVAFSNQITATGTDPITFSGTGLPGGLNIATNGLITGMPTTAGTNTATLTASNTFGTTNQSATFVIARGTPVISNWPTAAPITYGQTLSNSVLSGGTGSVTGNFTWTFPTNLPNAGTSSVSVTFLPTATNNYNPVTSTISLTVNQAVPGLTWTPSPAAGLTYPAPLSSTQLNATSPVAGSWSYSPASGAVLNAGTNTLVGTFTPADTNNYVGGTTITNTVVVAKGSNNILFGSLPVKYVGDAAFTLTATAGSGLPVTYTSSNPNVATVLGDLVTITGEGATTITASQAGDSNWNAATPVSQTLTVRPTLYRGLVAYYPFNGNANDESGNGRHGTVNGATLTSNRHGITNQAYSFSQTNFISAPVPSEIMKTNYALSLWVKADVIDSPYPTFVFQNYYNLGFKTNGGTTQLVSYYSDASSSPYVIGELNASLPGADRWNHFVVTGTNGTNTSLYINGVLATSQNHILPAGISGTGFKLGTGHNPPTTSFRGKMDDVRFYDRTLSATEVEELYHREIPPIEESFGSGTNAFSMEFVRIGNAGNVADTKGAPNPAGSVAYAYRIGKHEVSREMIQKANQLGGLGITLADMSAFAEWGATGTRRPATGISLNEAARFVNWLNVSRGYLPAYKFTYQPGEAGYAVNIRPIAWSPSDQGYDTNNPVRNRFALFFLPSVDEWYKAAYFDPVINYYYEWPTGSDQGLAEAQSIGGGWTHPPGGTAPGTAVYYGHHGPADIDNAGGLSPYGTMAQGGNAFEWQETGTVRGGSWGSFAFSGGRLALSSGVTSDFSGNYESESNEMGFRVASSATLTSPPGLAPVITLAGNLSGQVGTPASYTVTASGTAPITFSATNLPSGLGISSSNGLISGVPTVAGSGTATITATNALGTNSASLAWTISPKPAVTILGAVIVPKTYNGNRVATVDWDNHVLDGVAAGHEVSLVTDGAVAEYADANAGEGKSVSVTGLSLSGADAGRYQLGSVLLLTGDIGKRDLNIGNLSVLEKRYDGSVAAPLSWSNHSLSGYATNEGTNQARVAQPYARGKYSSALVGSNKAVIGWFELPVLEGTGSANYRLVLPGSLTGTVLKGWAGIEIQGTNQVYGKTNRGVTVATTNLTGTNPVLEVVYTGTNGTVYGPSTNVGPLNAGSYHVIARVAETDNTYEGTNETVLVITRKPAILTALSDTIRAGTGFGGNRFTTSGFLSGDEPTGTLATHLKSVTNTNPLVSYNTTNNQSGVYRILRGTMGDNVTNNYQVEYREGTLTVLKESLLTEGAVTPLAAGLNYTLVVQSNATVRAFGSNSVVVGSLPSILTNGTAEVAGVGSGAAANFGMGWTRDGIGQVWGSLSQTVENVAGMGGGNGFVGYVRGDGTAGTWGSNAPVVPTSLTQSNAGVVAVAVGDTHVLAVRTNGSVVGWGTYSSWGGSATTSPPAGLNNAVGVAAGQYHGAALKADGTVAAWGSGGFAVTNVPAELTNRSATNFVRAVSMVSASTYTLVLRADGSVRGWGQNAPTNLPAGLINTMGTNPVVSLAMAQQHAVALQRDGTVTVWGTTNSQTLTVPAGLKGRVPMGGADSDRDGWANEAELRVGSDPLSTNSYPRKASFGVSYGYGTNGSSFQTERAVEEGTNRVVGTVAILDSMGRLEDGNQPQMSVELGSGEIFELTASRQLRFKADPVFDGVQTNNNVYLVDIVVKDSPLAAPITTTLTVRVEDVVQDVVPPTISLIGAARMRIDVLGSFADPGARVTDNFDDLRVIAGSGTVNPALAGTYTLTYTASDAAGNAAIPVTRTVVVGQTGDTWLEGTGLTMTPALLLKYAVGGADGPYGVSLPPTTVVGTNGQGQLVLTMTELVRIDDPSLQVVGRSVADLGNPGSITTVAGVAAADQSGVPAGYQRQVFTAPATSGNRQFLWLDVTR